MAIATYQQLKTAVENFLGKTDQAARVPEWIALCEDRIAQNMRIQAMETSAFIVWKSPTSGGTVGGTANAITLTGITTPALGDVVYFTAALTNTAAVTLNTSYALKRRHGGVKQTLSAGDVIIGAEVRAVYDGTDFVLAPPGGALLPSDFLEQRRQYFDLSADKRLDFFSSNVFWGCNFADESGQPDVYTIEGDFVVAAPVPDTTYRARMLYYRRLASLSGSTDTNWILTNARGIYLYGTLLEASVMLEDDAGALKYSSMFEQAVDDCHDADRRNRFPAGALSTRSQVSVV